MRRDFSSSFFIINFVHISACFLIAELLEVLFRDVSESFTVLAQPPFIPQQNLLFKCNPQLKRNAVSGLSGVSMTLPYSVSQEHSGPCHAS